jgi:hypothetical protein
MTYIPDTLREQVVKRAHRRCEYCQTQQAIVVSMEIDHIMPESAGGKTSLDNLCLACIGCNTYKLNYQTGINSTTGEEVILYYPRFQSWHEHFRWSEDGVMLYGITNTGRATIERLKINREGMLSARRLWVEAGWHPPHSD